MGMALGDGQARWWMQKGVFLLPGRENLKEESIHVGIENTEFGVSRKEKGVKRGQSGWQIASF
jgi:hypothetical protein